MNDPLKYQSSLASLFRIPGYTCFTAIRIAATLATWLDITLIFTLLAFEFKVSPGTLGYASAMLWLPGLLFAPAVGALCDKVSPTAMLVTGSLLLVLISVAMWQTTRVEWFIYLMFLRSFASLSIVSSAVINRLLCSDDDILQSSRIKVLIDQGTKILAPLIAAGFAFFAAPQTGFIVSAILALLCVGLALKLSTTLVLCKHPAEIKPPTSPLLRAIKITFGRGSPIRAATLIYAAISIVMGLSSAPVLIMLRDSTLPESTYGLTMVAAACGAVACGLWFKKIVGNARPEIILQIAIGIFSTGVVLLGVLPLLNRPLLFWPIALIYFTNGLSFAAAMICCGTCIQLHAPKAIIGAVSATSSWLSMVAMVIAPIVSGWLLVHLTSTTTLFISGGLGIIAACFAIALQNKPRLQIS